MTNITLDNITQAVINHGDGGQSHPRLYEIYTSLVTHLHTFVREVNLTEQELQLGRDFLNRASHYTQEIPSGEIHMLTDLLGISELVELLHDINRGTATESNLEGPLYVPDAPKRQMGDRLGVDQAGDRLLLSGYVLDLNGQPIPDALIEVWQSNSQGLYDLQDPSQPQGNFRGCFRTKADGKYEFETVVPQGYNVPASGPSGEVLRLLGRHTWRAAHIHFKLSAAGYSPLITQIFIDGDSHIDSDTTFSVKSAIVKLQKHERPEELFAHNQNKPFYTTEFNFVLQPTASETSRVEHLTLLKQAGG
ncbi:MAG: hydroxyquinol 1,2-dioxygenase [Komarekiella atlantica HA4396-MV6]|jgi:catechol 1,2-dioxygenase/hydroxyquinol 1,2-dioxygenase|nr:hydroxyquinol 1,2-dioxygenase [Komarekiella atlantica HA4396-MV6]